jgi:tetratricopeptide (TPR) repeat protein
VRPKRSPGASAISDAWPWRRALATAEALEDFAVRINANVRLGRVHYARGDYESSVNIVTENVELLTGEATTELFGLLQPPSIYSRTWLVASLVELGRFAEARATAESSLEIAGALDPWIANFSYVALGFIDLRTGELQRTIRRLEPALELIRTSGMAPWFPRLATILGSAYALSGRTAEALPLLEEVLQRALASRLHGARSQLVAQLGEAYLLAGRPREASETADLALDLSRKHGERGDEAWSLRLTGEIALQKGRPEDALNRFREALGLATELGMQPLVAHCHLGLARLHRSTGDRAAAAEKDTIATAMFRTLGMRPWPFEQD